MTFMSGFPKIGKWGVNDIRGTLLGSSLYGNPTIWGLHFGYLVFVNPPCQGVPTGNELCRACQFPDSAPSRTRACEFFRIPRCPLYRMRGFQVPNLRFQFTAPAVSESSFSSFPSHVFPVAEAEILAFRIRAFSFPNLQFQVPESRFFGFHSNPSVFSFRNCCGPCFCIHGCSCSCHCYC